MKRFLIILMLSLAAVSYADAQNCVSKETDMKFFTSVNVSDQFSLTLRKGTGYVLKTNIDERIEPFLIAYVQNDVLYLDIDRKKFTPELKKALRTAQGNGSVLEAEVSVPLLKSLEISDNALIKCLDVIETESFVLKATEKARVSDLEVMCSNAEVNISKSSAVNAEISASSVLKISSAGTSKAYVKHRGDSLSIASTGSSAIEAVIEVKGLMVDNSGMSSVNIVSGKAGSLMVDASGSARFNAADVAVPSVYMVQSGSSRSVVNVTDTLKVNLVGNSSLEFKGNPYIELEKIVSSTLTRYDATSSK